MEAFIQTNLVVLLRNWCAHEHRRITVKSSTVCVITPLVYFTQKKDMHRNVNHFVHSGTAALNFQRKGEQWYHGSYGVDQGRVLRLLSSGLKNILSPALACPIDYL